MSDLLIHNATLPDGRSGVDVLVADGRIVNVSPRINAAAAQTIDAQGYLLTPPFVDPHFHMDATLTYGAAARERERHAARGHRAVGRTEAPPDAGRDRRARARVLRLGGGEGAARDPLARRRVRPAPARGRGAAAREGEGGALPRPAAGRVSAGRRAAQPRRARPPEARARDGRGRRRRHSALRAHDARRHRERAAPVRARRGAGAARRHALRRDRRPQLAPHRDAGRADAAARPAGAGDRVAPDVDALDGQLLRVEAHSADPRGGRRRGRQSADQHHDPGAARHLPEAPRHDARARADGRGRHRRVRPRLRDGPVVFAGQRRQPRSRVDGTARRADDEPGGHARVLRRGDGQRREDPPPRRLRHRARQPRRLRAAAGARPHRGDPSPRAAAQGVPRGQGHRRDAGGDGGAARFPGDRSSVDWSLHRGAS